MANKPTAYNNRLGLKGWVYAGNYTFERYLYIGHRLSVRIDLLHGPAHHRDGRIVCAARKPGQR